MINDYIDMDTKSIRYVSESSNASTSGYSTMSPGHASLQSTPPSPSQSPASLLQTEFSNLNLPSVSPQPCYATLQNATLVYNNQNVLPSAPTNNYIHYNIPGTGMPSTMVSLTQHQYGGLHQQSSQMLPNLSVPSASTIPTGLSHGKYPAELRILEHPVEKFRFRYKSEMHGTHGSLNGANSKRTPKTFPEVELCNFNGKAVIRCSLFQTNLESPHSHQLVVRKDDTDICDPHNLIVSPERGYVAQFQNMGIIHTAKKFIFEELLKKKMDRLKFELARNELTTKEVQELHKQTEKETKEMNLNQVRLCFEAFKVEDDDITYTRIAAPVYTNPINNRKSAQTGELRICRLSIVTGSVSGGDDLILLVEKVSKKNIKVRFYETNEDDEIVWEAYGKFRESDVHHQYAIVCQTPPYKDKEVDRPVDVYVELVRPSDDERSYPPATFRYKPRDIVVSRKRRRTCSSATSSSGSGSSLSSFELPKPVQEQTANIKMEVSQTQMQYTDMGSSHYMNQPTISEEYDKNFQISKLIGSDIFKECMHMNSEELAKICPTDSTDAIDSLYSELSSTGTLVEDGTSSTSLTNRQLSSDMRKIYVKSILGTQVDVHTNSNLERIFKIFDGIRTTKNLDQDTFAKAAKMVDEIFIEHAERNELRESILHEIIVSDNPKLVMKTCHILDYFKLKYLFSKVLNARNESALHTACLYNREKYIRPLIGLGCDPNIQNTYGDTALHIAVKEHHQKCIESFLNSDIQPDLTIKNDEGFTPLHLAIRQNNYDVAKKLLQHDRSAALVPNAKECNNGLHMAVLQSNFELVKLILDTTQNVSELIRASNAAGRTAGDLASELDSKMGSQIITWFASLGYNVDYDNRLVIKEEEMSSSSNEDDEDAESTITVTNISDEIKDIGKFRIKDEFVGMGLDAGELQRDKLKNQVLPCNFDELLCDESRYRALANALNVQDKWKRLAVPCKMQHLLCLWNNADDMLEYMRKNIDYETFVSALELIDKKILKLLQEG
ncbi:PREDICTED: nuclear factor NF-kappa-B p110 subunit [Rhagoletis zephyria]|uniref:nuclear factor NF-kappa-B p110 subunit n=1 Tax=Rhagoletis zephyria TaxID=28612 RepID=UPI0008117711|nr:PREDICTED: nuclear factor NF-kappa-B p110 subunit [Rhagoletis zephyria]